MLWGKILHKRWLWTQHFCQCLVSTDLVAPALRDDLASQQRALTSTVARLSDSQEPAQMLAAWQERYAPAIARLEAMIEELKRQGNLDLAVLSVLLRELRALA